jgi:hypothetical protein
METIGRGPEDITNYGQMLAESETYRPFVEDMTDKYKRNCTAIMLENTRRFLASLDETTRAIAVGDFEKYIFA